MRKRSIAVAALLFGLLAAGPAAAAAANAVHVTDDFEDGSLDNAEWEEHEGLAVEGGRLTLAEGCAVGRGRLRLPEPPTEQNLTFTAAGVDLSAGGRHLRAIGLRVRRVDGGTGEGEVVFGVLRVWCADREGAQTKAELRLGVVGGGPPQVADATGELAGGNKDLVLELHGASARLELGAASVAMALSVVGDIRLCRVELHGDAALGAKPYVDEISAQSN